MVRACNRIEYKKGEKLGDSGITYIEEKDPVRPGSNGDLVRRALFLCHCGKEYVCSIGNVKRNASKSCGCSRKNSPLKIKYKSGDIINGLALIKETKSNNGIRNAIFKCTCGTLFETRICYVRSRNTRSCGCLHDKTMHENRHKHGCRYHPKYNTWRNVKSRCYNKKDSNYKYYGGRGISMSDEFKINAGVFIRYIESLKNYGKAGYSIDRINNDGNYERGNLRWATSSTQVSNQNIKCTNTTGFTGVHPSGSTWYVSIGLNGEYHFIHGDFHTPEAAAIARDEYIIENNLPHRLSGLNLE